MSASPISRRLFLSAAVGFGAFGLAVAGLSAGRSPANPVDAPQEPDAPRFPGIAEDGWLLTEADRAEFAAADALISSETLVIQDAVDLPGGDLTALRVSDLGDCVAACEGNDACHGFTYARASHPLPEKRRMCWLKSEEASSRVTDVREYVSGGRSGWLDF